MPGRLEGRLGRVVFDVSCFGGAAVSGAASARVVEVVGRLEVAVVVVDWRTANRMEVEWRCRRC